MPVRAERTQVSGTSASDRREPADYFYRHDLTSNHKLSNQLWSIQPMKFITNSFAMRLVSRALALAVITAFSQPAPAASWSGNFTITNIFVAGANNFHYRIYGMPTYSACSNGPTWGYLNKGDSGSEGYIAALLMAFASGKQVGLFVEEVNGYCHILEVFISA